MLLIVFDRNYEHGWNKQPVQVAEALNQPFAALSLEMVYRNLHFFTTAFQRGEATDVIQYMATNAKWLGVLKQKRKRRPSPLQLFDLTNSASP